MKRGTKALLALVMAGSATLFVGCGTSTDTNSTSNTANANNATSNSTTTKPSSSSTGKVMVIGGQQYEGSANLKKYESKAAANPNNAEAQIDAGRSAHVNGDDKAAISYYEKAIKIDPKNAQAYNNIGNIYFRDMNQPRSAVPYYQKATQADPTYVYGWWNLALAEKALGNNTAAQEAVKEGLQKVPKSDPNYKNLENALK